MRAFIRIFNRIEEWTLVFTLLGLAFLICIQVFCRYVLNFSFSWMDEVGRYSGVFVTFLGASLGVKYGTHFSMEFVYEKVSNDHFRNGLRVLVNVMCGILFLAIAWYGWKQTMKLRQFGALTASLQFPKYWTYLPVPFFSVIMSFRFFNLSVKYLARLIRGMPFKIVRGEES